MKCLCNRLRTIGKCIVTLSLMPAFVYAQAPDTLWTKTYDGLGYDEGFSIQQTADDGFIIVGNSGSSWLIRDVYLVRTDSLGDTLWTRRYGGSDDDRGQSVMQTSNNGFLVAGYTQSFGAGNYDFYLVRTDSLGDTLWTRTYGGPDEDFCGEAQLTSDHGCIMVGNTLSFGAGDYDFYIVKTDSLGNTLWTKTYDGTGDDYCGAVQQTEENGYILVGTTIYSGGDNSDVYLVKTDSLGDTLWTRHYGGLDLEAGKSVQLTFDHGYIIAGYTCSFGAGGDVYLLRTDANGDTLWTRYWGGSAVEAGRSAIQTSDGRFTVASMDDRDYGVNNDSDIWLLRVDAVGDTVWTTRYGDINHDEWPWSMLRTTDGGYAIVGRKALHDWSLGDVYLVKTAPDTFGIAEYSSRTEVVHLLDVVPNPFRDKTEIKFRKADNSTVELCIYDVTGRLLKKLSCLTGQPNHIIWAGDDDEGKKLPNGVYFLRYQCGNCTASKTLILLR